MGIPFKQSPNYHAGRFKNVSHIVIHAMLGWYKFTTESLFMNPKSEVSAHYCISQKGDILQMVKDQDTAYHVCIANPFCIGIEHENGLTSLADPSWITDPMWQRSVQLTASLCVKFNIPVSNVIGHNDPLLRLYHNNHQDPGGAWDMVKYRKDVQAEIDKIHPIKKMASQFMAGWNYKFPLANKFPIIYPEAK